MLLFETELEERALKNQASMNSGWVLQGQRGFNLVFKLASHKKKDKQFIGFQDNLLTIWGYWKEEGKKKQMVPTRRAGYDDGYQEMATQSLFVVYMA